MADNSYAQLIDDFDNGIQVLEGETLTEYIKRMGGVDYNAHGGSVGIEVLFNKRKDFASGGWSPGVGRDTRGYQSGHGSYSGGGGDGGHHPPVIIPKKKPIAPIIKDDNPPWYSPNQLINNPLLNFINPKSKIGMGLNIFKTLKNFEPTEEDVTLGKTSEVISDLPDDSLLAFKSGSIKDRKLKQLHNQKKEGLMWNEQNEKTYQNLLKEDKEQTKYPKTQLTADGGRVGFENGGWADDLTGEALSIYNSMSAYNASDADIQAKLQEQNLWSPGGTTTDTEQITGIINQNIGGGGGGGIGDLDLTYREGAKAKTIPGLTENQLANKAYWQDQNWTPQMAANKAYWENQPDKKQGILTKAGEMWDSTKDFFSGLGTPRERGTLGTRLSNKPSIPLPAAMASWSLSPFNEASRNYNPLFEDQLNFLEMQDNMIGRDQGTGLLRYGPDSVLSGKNVISGFGSNNYQVALDKEIERLEGIYEKNKDKWSPEKIAGWKAKFYDPAIKERNKANQTFAEKQAEIEAAKAAASRAESARQYDPNVHGPTNYGLGADGQQSYDLNPGSGVGWSATGTGPVSNKTGKGRTDWADGGRAGLATMFTRRR